MRKSCCPAWAALLHACMTTARCHRALPQPADASQQCQSSAGLLPTSAALAGDAAAADDGAVRSAAGAHAAPAPARRQGDQTTEAEPGSAHAACGWVQARRQQCSHLPRRLPPAAYAQAAQWTPRSKRAPDTSWLSDQLACQASQAVRLAPCRACPRRPEQRRRRRAAAGARPGPAPRRQR